MTERFGERRRSALRLPLKDVITALIRNRAYAQTGLPALQFLHISKLLRLFSSTPRLALVRVGFNRLGGFDHIHPLGPCFQRGDLRGQGSDVQRATINRTVKTRCSVITITT